MSIVPIFKRRIFTRKVIYRLFQLTVWTFQKCKNAHACALQDCLGISRPFVSDTSPKCIDREGLERRRTGTRQHKHKHCSFQGKITFEQKCTLVCQTWMATLLNWLARKKLPQNHSLSLYHCNLFLRGGHDTILSQITCEKARIWTSFWLDRKKYGWFALFRLAKMPPSISCCWFQSASLLAQWAVNTHASSLWNFGRLSFLE